MKKLLMLSLVFVIGTAFGETKNITWKVGDNTYATSTCEVGDDLIIPKTPPTKYGYHFVGWSSYLFLEYIESTGTQYIDTGFKPNQDTKVEVDFEFNTSLSRNTLFFGSTSGWTVDSFGFYIGTGSNVYSNYNSDTNITNYFRPNVDTRYLYTHDKQNVYVDDILKYSHSALTFQSTRNLLLGFVEDNSSFSFRGKYYSIKIWDNGVLARNFVPCMNASNVVGMYDTVTNTFFTNAGTGEFIAGPVKQ